MTVAAIWKDHEIRRGARRGIIERREACPYADGFYRLADPKLGKGHHKDENATKVATLDEAARYVRRGFSIRMLSGAGKASLNIADGIVVEE